MGYDLWPIGHRANWANAIDQANTVVFFIFLLGISLNTCIVASHTLHIYLYYMYMIQQSFKHKCKTYTYDLKRKQLQDIDTEGKIRT